MGADSKSQQAQKVQDSQAQPTKEKEKQGDGSNQGAGKRKPQDKDGKDNKEAKNKRRRADKPGIVKGIRFRLLCHEGQAGAVIGKGGETVRNIRKTSNSEVSVLPPIQGHRLRIVVIDSAPGNRGTMTYPAKEALLTCATLMVEGDQPLNAPDPSKMVEVRMLVQSSLATGLLGVKHSLGSLTAGDISARCGAHVVMPPDPDRPKLAEAEEEYLLLRGPWPSVYAALGLVADEIRRQFFELREPALEPPPLGPPPGAFGFSAGPPLGPPLAPFNPLEAMQLGIGLGMEMAVAAGVAAGAPHLGGPVHANAPVPVGGNGGGPSAPQSGDLSMAGLVPEFRSPAEASTPVTVTFKLIVPESKAGRFIGKGGENLRELRQALGLSTLKVHPPVKDTSIRVLEVTSTEPAASDRCGAAEALLHYVERLGASVAQGTGGGNRARFTVKMLLQQQHCGPVVGPRAAVIRQLSTLTNTSCVVHKKGDLPAYGSADEQELEADGEPLNVAEAIRMVAAIVRGCELRRQGITVRETMGTPEFDLVRGARGGGGGGPASHSFPPLGPLVTGPRELEGNWPPPDVPDHGPGTAIAAQPGPSIPSQQQQHRQMQQQQQQQQQHSHEQQQSQAHVHMPQAGTAAPKPQQQQLPPHLQAKQQRQQQQQQQRQQSQLGPGAGGGPSADQGQVASQGGHMVAGLAPLGPNDVRLTIFVASALVNAPEGINGTNVQQVQAVTNTLVTLRQPVARGDYELDITGTFAQVMQAHTLLSNIMTIGAILQQKPQLAPQQAPPPASVGTTATAGGGSVTGGDGTAGGTAQPGSGSTTATVTTASGAQHQVMVQPNQGVVISSQPPPQQTASAVQMMPQPQQAASQQQQQQQSGPQPAGQVQSAPQSAQTAPLQAQAAYASAGQQMPSSQQQQQQQIPQQQTQQQRQGSQQQTPEALPQQQTQAQQYSFSAEQAASTQQDSAAQRQAQAQQQQRHPGQQPYPTTPQPAQLQQQQQQTVSSAAPHLGGTPTSYQQQQQQPPGPVTYPQSTASPPAAQPPQQYASQPPSQVQLPYSQAYPQPYPQQSQTPQHGYYGGQQAVQAQQPQPSPYATYTSSAYSSPVGYGNAGGNTQATAGTSVPTGGQAPAVAAAGTFESQYAQATVPSSSTAVASTPSAPSTAGPYGQQHQFPGYSAVGYASVPPSGHPYYQQPQQQQQQQPGATQPATHDQYYMHMQQQYAAYQAAAAAAAGNGPYPPGAYGYGYGSTPAPAPQ